MTKRKYGDRDACRLCGQDIEWHGKAHGWLDRGGNRQCVAYFATDGEIVQPPKTAKHVSQSEVLDDYREECKADYERTGEDE